MQLKEKAFKDHIPIIQDEGLLFLLSFLKDHSEIQNILEVGTAIGYSAIQMAKVYFDLKIDTLEINVERYIQAVANIKKEHLEKQINVYLTDAAIFKTNKVYDLVFIDAAKAQYARYLEHFLMNTVIGTYFIFDNLMFHGMVENNSLSHNRSTKQLVSKIRKFRERLRKDYRFQTDFYLTVGDGMAVSKRIL